MILESIHKLWNQTLKACEEGELYNTLNTIKETEGGNFWEQVKNKFLEEFNNVLAIDTGSDYKFQYEPTLMQKLMAYRLMTNKSYGNWCGTGAGNLNHFEQFANGVSE